MKAAATTAMLGARGLKSAQGQGTGNRRSQTVALRWCFVSTFGTVGGQRLIPSPIQGGRLAGSTRGSAEANCGDLLSCGWVWGIRGGQMPGLV